MHLAISQRIFRPADHAIDIGAILNGYCLVENIAFNLGTRIEVNPQAPNGSKHPSTDEDLLCHQFALDKSVHVNHAGFGPDRAEYRSVNVQFAGRGDVAFDGHILCHN